jgi:LAO/AO transport system kinase
LVLVNKADGDLKSAATRTQADYAGALRLLRKRDGDPEGFPKAAAVSAIEDDGLEKAWNEMQTLASWRQKTGYWASRRAAQSVHWFHSELQAQLLAKLTHSSETAALIDALAGKVSGGTVSPEAAAASVIASLS